MYIHTYVCMYVYIYIYTYIYVYVAYHSIASCHMIVCVVIVWYIVVCRSVL